MTVDTYRNIGIGLRQCRLRLAAGLLAVSFIPQLASAQLEVQVGAPGQSVAATPAPAGTPAPKLNEDKDAVKSAEKIFPAPGTQLNSTEERSLGQGQAVVGTPAVKFTQDGKVVLPDATGTGAASEAKAVKSGAEMLKILGLVPKPKAEGGLESEENNSLSLFDKEAVEKLLGTKPTVVYRVVSEETPLPDPMIIPWIRNVRLIEENFNKAVEKLANNEVDEARAILLDIVTQFPSGVRGTGSAAFKED